MDSYLIFRFDDQKNRQLFRMEEVEKDRDVVESNELGRLEPKVSTIYDVISMYFC